MSLLDIGLLMRAEVDDNCYEIWIVLLWMVWRLVCRWKHDEVEEGVDVSEEQARIFRDAFHQAKPTTSMAATLGMVPGGRIWIRPQRGRLGADVDALFDRSNGRFGVGLIVRDEFNNILLAVSRRVAPSSSVVGAELKAVVFAITDCIKAQLGPIEIFSDSFTVARVLNDPEEASELLSEDIQEIMNDTRGVLVVGVCHAYRSAIRAAHSLAQYAAQISSPSVWTHDFPAWLLEIVSSDES